MLTWDDEANKMDYALQLQSQNLEETSVDAEHKNGLGGLDKPADNFAALQPKERVQQLNEISIEKKATENPPNLEIFHFKQGLFEKY